MESLFQYRTLGKIILFILLSGCSVNLNNEYLKEDGFKYYNEILFDTIAFDEQMVDSIELIDVVIDSNVNNNAIFEEGYDSGVESVIVGDISNDGNIDIIDIIQLVEIILISEVPAFIYQNNYNSAK